LRKLNKDTFLSEINNNGGCSQEVGLKSLSSYCQQDLETQNAANVTVVTAV